MGKDWMLRHGAFSPVAPEEQGGTPSRFTLWGVVNVTPDSFFDGGSHDTPQEAVLHALSLASSGARVLDIGGASSRPGADDVSAAEEARRIMPVLHRLSALRSTPSSGLQDGKERLSSRTLISVDTWRAEVAAQAMEAGADILNDISACSWEPALIDVAAQYRPGYVLMHCPAGVRPGTMQDSPRYESITDEVCAFFEERMAALARAGLPESHIMLDPGIGFGKTAGHNCELLAGMEKIMALGRPILLGVSNKSLFGLLLGLDTKQRGEATRVCTSLLAARGIAHHRVHDVTSARQALELVERFTPWMD